MMAQHGKERLLKNKNSGYGLASEEVGFEPAEHKNAQGSVVISKEEQAVRDSLIESIRQSNFSDTQTFTRTLAVINPKAFEDQEYIENLYQAVLDQLVENTLSVESKKDKEGQITASVKHAYTLEQQADIRQQVDGPLRSYVGKPSGQDESYQQRRERKQVASATNIVVSFTINQQNQYSVENQRDLSSERFLNYLKKVIICPKIKSLDEIDLNLYGQKTEKLPTTLLYETVNKGEYRKEELEKNLRQVTQSPLWFLVPKQLRQGYFDHLEDTCFKQLKNENLFLKSVFHEVVTNQVCSGAANTAQRQGLVAQLNQYPQVQFLKKCYAHLVDNSAEQQRKLAIISGELGFFKSAFNSLTNFIGNASKPGADKGVKPN